MSYNTNLSSLISNKSTHSISPTQASINNLAAILSFLDTKKNESNNISPLKLVITPYSTIAVSNPSLILPNLPINHPIAKLFSIYLEKAQTLNIPQNLFIHLTHSTLTLTNSLLNKNIKPGDINKVYSQFISHIRQCAKNSQKNTQIILSSSESNILDKLLIPFINSSKLRNLVIQAILTTKSMDIDRIRTVKAIRGNIEDSYLIKGMVIERRPCTKNKILIPRNNKFDPSITEEYSVSIYDCPFDISRTETKGTLLFTDSKELLSYSSNSLENIENLVNEIQSDVVICNGKIEDIHLQMINMKNMVGIKILSKHDIRRLQIMCGGSVNKVMGSGCVGSLRGVGIFRENEEYSVIYGNGKVVSIVMCESVESRIADWEREIEDGLNMLKRYFIKEEKESEKGSFNTLSLPCYFKDLSSFLLNVSKSYEDISRLIYKQLGVMYGDMVITGEYACEGVIRCFEYCMEIMGVILQTSEYVLVKGEGVTVRENKGWDND
ncbi:subunit theta of T-complex protein 1 [Hamiltosporidium tvaerminnensis]|uniref:Subunit theta of T-complex protein 1 n=3 Tax=Hamiltosporidium TaxID=1176354 RepID=A0A4Q9LXL7_9MICR|nr:subunit theta of T-complex protein 1 [Hamiltosporidium tvaerminnensis]TBU08164.1 subunit theta of T-complex protein 1 [Hamiltosporidium magnivora]TBU13454.1 subunit theta of T-complex protein 1 [Hamiltosporidium tvaerminnensis]